MSTLLLIQSDPVAAERSRQALSDAGLGIAACVGTLAQAAEVLARLTPDLVLADLRFEDGRATELLDLLGGSGRNSRSLCVVIAPAAQDPMLMDALRHGAAGYVIGGHPAETLVATVHAVLAGESPMSPEIACEVRAYFDSQVWDDTDFIGESQNPMHLSDNERQLLDWIAEGRQLSEIADEIFTTPHLLGVQLRALFLRMQFGVAADTLTLQLL